jgi:uncharacterized cupredoxin-like copper-binding protein
VAIAAKPRQVTATQTLVLSQPGNPKKMARIVQITMRESDGKMMYVPEKVEVRRASRSNSSYATTADWTMNLSSRPLRKTSSTPKNEEEPGDGTTIKRPTTRAKASQRNRLEVHGGKFEFSCLIPGHRGGGMTGNVIVK